MFKLHTSRLAVLPLIVLLSGLGDAITIRISDGLTQYFVPDERARMHSAVLELEMMALPDVTDFFLPSSLGIRDETLGLIVGFMTNVSLTQVYSQSLACCLMLPTNDQGSHDRSKMRVSGSGTSLGREMLPTTRW